MVYDVFILKCCQKWSLSARGIAPHDD